MEYLSLIITFFCFVSFGLHYSNRKKIIELQEILHERNKSQLEFNRNIKTSVTNVAKTIDTIINAQKTH